MEQNKEQKKRMPEQYDTEDTIDLLELFCVLPNHWKLIFLVMIICGCLAGVYNHFLIESTYRANEEIYITNTNTVISFQDVQLSEALTVDYEEVIRSRTVLKKVIKDQKLNMTFSELREMITVENPADSHCLKIYVESMNPAQSVSITNSLVKYGIDQIFRVVGNDEPTIIDYAEADSVEEIRPELKKYILIGSLAGAFVICGFFIIRFLLDATLKTEEDIEKYMGYTVLASIPEHKETNKDKSKKKNKRRRKE